MVQSLETIFGKNYFENQKNFLKSLEIWFKGWKHIFGKNYFENQKIQLSKFDSNVLNFCKNWAEIVLKPDKSEGKILKICIKIK